MLRRSASPLDSGPAFTRILATSGMTSTTSSSTGMRLTSWAASPDFFIIDAHRDVAQSCCFDLRGGTIGGRLGTHILKKGSLYPVDEIVVNLGRCEDALGLLKGFLGFQIPLMPFSELFNFDPLTQVVAVRVGQPLLVFGQSEVRYGRH